MSDNQDDETYSNNNFDLISNASSLISLGNNANANNEVPQASSSPTTSRKDEKSGNDHSTSTNTDFKANSRPRILQRFKRESSEVSSSLTETSQLPSSPDIDTAKKFKNEKNKNDSKSTNPNSRSQKSKSKLTNESNIQTQTDWSWIQDMQIMERIRKEGAEFLNDLFDEIRSESGESENESVDDASNKEPAKPLSRIEMVGPPKILQYVPEAVKNPSNFSSSSPAMSVTSEPIENFQSFMKDLNVYIAGGNSCEFCNKVTKKWPSIEDQDSKDPELLHCCNDYREFVEALIEYQNQKDHLRRTQDVTSSGNPVEEVKTLKSRKAKQLAQERADFKNMQRMLLRQKRMEQMVKEKQTTITGGQTQESKSQDSIRDPVSNQIRSINYQLSNLKFLQDGWTVRPTSPIDFDEINLNEIEFNLIAQKINNPNEKDDDKSLVVRNYKSGGIFLVLFPDGSGSVFYPSGNVAISITCISRGMHILSTFSDEDAARSTQTGSFDPYGNGFVNYSNGKLRVVLNPFGGIEFDSEGAKKKRWFWSDLSEHVHAPPLQPIIFALNHYISVKILKKDKIKINFVGENQMMCRFTVGSKLKISSPDVLSPSIKYDATEVYLRKKKSQISDLLRILNEESNPLKLPKLNLNSSREFNTSMKTPCGNSTTDIFKLSQPKDTYRPKKSTQKPNKFLAVP